MNLFPTTNFRKEFHFYPEIERVVERATELFEEIFSPGDAVTIKTILNNPEIASRVRTSLETMEIYNPFRTQDPLVKVAIVAAMANEGVEASEFYILNKWPSPKFFSGLRLKNADELWVNLALPDRNSAVLRSLNEANWRHGIAMATGPTASIFANVQNKELPALGFVLYKVALGDRNPLVGVSIDFGDEKTFQIILAMNGSGDHHPGGYCDDQLEAAITEMWDFTQNGSWFEQMAHAYFLGIFMSTFVRVWLSRGVPEHEVVDQAWRRIRLFLRVSGIHGEQARDIEQVTLARLLFPMTTLISAFVEDPYAVLGIDLALEGELSGFRNELLGIMSAEYNEEEGRLLAVQLQKVGVDLSSVRAMRRIGYQLVGSQMISTQAIEPSLLEERYRAFLSGSKIPRWVHDGEQFNPQLSNEFLAKVIQYTGQNNSGMICVGGKDEPKSSLLNSLMLIEAHRLHAFVAALDAVGALDAPLLSSLDLDAESFGFDRVASLSPKGRGAFVSQAIGL
jgi:hypothetical protein